MQIEDQIREILVQRLNLDPVAVAACTTDTPLFGRGMGLDSVESLSLVAGIEEAFDLQFEDDELTADLFASLDALVQRVHLKRGGYPPP